MSFPSSPVNGQTTTTNGIIYSYNSTNNAWLRVPSTVYSVGSLSVTGTTPSTSTTTGALVIAGPGGIGVGGNIYAGGTVSASTAAVIGSTAASSTNTGALTVTGGLGVGGNIYAGGNLYTNGTQIIPTAIQEFTAAANTTTFTITGGYTVGTVQVFANGVQLSSADYTASNGTTVVLTQPRAAGDIIRTVAGLSSNAINNIQTFSIAMSVALG
jgi:hypothetical protein